MLPKVIQQPTNNQFVATKQVFHTEFISRVYDHISLITVYPFLAGG